MTNTELLKIIAKAAREGATSFDLSGEGIKTIPLEIANLTNLTTLYLNNNQITHIPETIGKLFSLTVLKLNGNRITEIPEALTKPTLEGIAKLTRLKVHLDNPMP